MRPIAHSHVPQRTAGRLLAAALTLVAPAAAITTPAGAQSPPTSPVPTSAPAAPLDELAEILRSLEDPALPPDRRAALIDRSIGSSTRVPS